MASFSPLAHADKTWLKVNTQNSEAIAEFETINNEVATP
jgi:hypothetical protein